MALTKVFIGMSVIILLVIGGFVVAYYFSEKKIEQNSVNLVLNLYIKTINSETNQQVSTGIKVLMQDGPVYLNTTTTENDYKLINIPSNTTFSIYTFNINQNFYTSKIDRDSFDKTTLRADVYLTPKGNISVIQQSSFFDSNPFLISIVSNGTTHIKEVCFRWSYNFIDVSIDYPTVQKPDRLLNKVDRCYDVSQNYTTYLNLPIFYRVSTGLQSSDSINLYILDSDIQKGGNLDVSNEFGNYSGIEDTVFTLR